MGGEQPPGLNFIDTLRTIEKSKETIVNRANKVMGPAAGLYVAPSIRIIQISEGSK